jgi:hypothetical protein
VQVCPHPNGLRDQLNLDQTNPTRIPGGLGIGDSPGATATTASAATPTRPDSVASFLCCDRFGVSYGAAQ